VIAMEHVGVKIYAVRPADGAGNRVKAYLGKTRLVINARENSWKSACEVEFSYQAV
jgi:hypothetical protein